MSSSLQNLSQQQLSLALSWLDSPDPHPPEELQHLDPLDWALLQQLLENLMWERQYSQLH
jgi:hypothetical protein